MSRSEKGVLNTEEETPVGEGEGCRKLMAAIIERAVGDACRIPVSGWVDHEEDAVDAARWLFSDYITDREWSLRWICSELNKPVGTIRRGTFVEIERKFKRDVRKIGVDPRCDGHWLASRWSDLLRIISETAWGFRELEKRRKMAGGGRYAQGFGKAWIGECQDE